MTGGRHTQRGAIPVETALVMPVLLMFVLTALAVGRVQTSGGIVDAAAREAARAASLARTPAAAHTAARSAADGTLRQQGLRCAHRSVHLDTSGFGVPDSDVGTVRAAIHCQVPLGDLTSLGLPGTVSVDGDFTSVIDRYRAGAATPPEGGDA